MIRLSTAILVLPLCALAEYVGNVTGVVTDAVTRRPLANAAVVLIDKNPAGVLKARIDSRGRFLIHSVPVEYPYSIYSVFVSAPDHAAETLQNVKVLPGAVMALECTFALKPAGGSTSFDSYFAPPSFTYSHERAARPAGNVEAGKIFATREGLVGRTTANGHVIRADDRFVALPSRRALNERGHRTFLVRVAYGSRSATVPVWDIGPWNIKDDYWNASSERETFRSLRRGVPEAQAAYLDGFNGGRDGFGRKVMNPAGIDLSDAVFWRDLRMQDNDWIAVEYLWDPTVFSTGDTVPTRRRPSEPRRDTRRSGARTLQDIIALAEAILIRSRW